MGSSYKLWHKRLTKGDMLTRGQIIQFKNAIATGAKGFRIGGHNNNLTETECARLMDTFYDRCREIDGGGFKLTQEHTDFGLEWLRKDVKRAESIGVTTDMLDTFEEFRFVGARIVHINDWGYSTTVPIYRVLFERGYIDYSWSPWQGKVYA